MGISFSDKLVIAISSSAIFDTREAHAVYTDKTLESYVEYQIKHENSPFGKGSAFPFVKAMLHLLKENNIDDVEVVILSKNEPAAALRVTNSIEHYGLNITRTGFTGGTDISNYLAAFDVDLFLSTDESDVRNAIDKKFAAGIIYDSKNTYDIDENQVRIAFDGDAVLFSAESERIFKRSGIAAFRKNEVSKADIPLNPGPFNPFLRLLSEIQKKYPASKCPIRTALVTSRDMPTHKRVFKTLRRWGVTVNEAFFLGGMEKPDVLKAFGAHIFFDDQDAHVAPAAESVPSARVPVDYSDPSTQADLFSSDSIRSKKSIEIPPARRQFFEQECRSIFRQYDPSKRRVIPDEFREFIAAHSEKKEQETNDHAAARRGKILNNLSKYDIRSMENYTFHFNRDFKDVVPKLNKLIDE